MKKLIFIAVFFLVSVFSFSQSSFTKSDLNFSFTTSLIEEADYNVKTSNFENNKITSFEFAWTERVTYSYKDKVFKMWSPTNNVFEYEDAYVIADDSSNFINYYYVYCLAKPEGKEPFWVKMVEISKSGNNGRFILMTNVIDKDGNYIKTE